MGDIGFYILCGFLGLIGLLTGLFSSSSIGRRQGSLPDANDFNARLKMNRMADQYAWDHYERLKENRNKD